jgi:hypothetical protein
MKGFVYAAFLGLTAFVFSSCEAPPPGRVVFDESNNADEVIREYLEINEDALEGYKVIPVTTTSIRNPQDSTKVYVPDYEKAANFD